MSSDIVLQINPQKTLIFLKLLSGTFYLCCSVNVLKIANLDTTNQTASQGESPLQSFRGLLLRRKQVPATTSKDLIRSMDDGQDGQSGGQGPGGHS